MIYFLKKLYFGNINLHGGTNENIKFIIITEG